MPTLLPLALACLAGIASAQTVPATTKTYDTRACQAPYDQFPFCDVGLPIAARVADLIKRLLPAEIVPQLTARHNGGGSPGPDDNVTALGLPEFDWGLNAIHGVQASCVSSGGETICPTSWPNPVNFGMSFNKSLFFELGASIGVETRALWLAGAVEASTWSGRPHIGLDVWSPNININRDPRWGRNVEVPGEDPLLNGLFGELYTSGLQTSSLDSNYLQAVVTLKHLDAYSLDDSDNFTRNNFNAIVSQFALADTYLPAFKRAVVDGGALGIMCSYNAINGVPTCADPLLAHILRDVWGFEGYQTSDTGALENIWNPFPAGHGYAPSVAAGACAAIKAGRTDVCSGTTYASGLLEGVAQGLCSEADVVAALTNTFTLRFRLGLFDPAESAPYWHVPLSAVGTPATLAAVRLASLSGLVLLSNKGGSVLPLSPGQRVAVIGPHAMSQEDLAGNYLGQLCPDNTFDCIVTPFAAIAAANAGGVTKTEKGCDIDGNSTAGFAAAVALAQASDVVIFLIGIDGLVEGEMMDRKSIDLPAVQHALVAAVLAGAPHVTSAAVLINGGMVDVSAEVASVGAILEAGYPGVLGAAAIADTLYGANDHLGGKLPYTLYHADYVNEIAMSEMELDVGVGRSYRYYNGSQAPLFPFGHGLALTTFALDLAASPGAQVTLPTEAAPSRNLSFAVTVTNTGARTTGDEVVFAFFAPAGALPAQPASRLIKQLFDFERVHLAPGEATTLNFTVSTETLRMVDKATGDVVSTPGAFDIVFTNGVENTILASTITLTGSQVVVTPFPTV